MSAATIARAVERFHMADADMTEAKRDQDISRQAARRAKERAAVARAARFQALVDLALAPAESLAEIVAKARLVRDACGDERALASRIVNNEGIAVSERLALAVALDLVQLTKRAKFIATNGDAAE